MRAKSMVGSPGQARRAEILISAAVVFTVLAVAAMLAYPGGGVANVLYLIVLALYVLVLFAGPGLETKSGLEFQVAAPKIVIYSSIVNLAVQAVGIRREALAAAAG